MKSILTLLLIISALRCNCEIFSAINQLEVLAEQESIVLIKLKQFIEAENETSQYIKK